MTLRTLRNFAFVAMIVGGVSFFSVAGSAEEEKCWKCDGAGTGSSCEEVGEGVQGRRQCSDTFSCSVWGSLCTGTPILEGD